MTRCAVSRENPFMLSVWPLLLLAWPLAAAGKDFYALLGVERGASAAELKKAFHRESVKHHPDRCEADRKEECTRAYQEISRAYEVLTDEKRKEIYDRGGEEGLKEFESNTAGNRAGGPSNAYSNLPIRGKMEPTLLFYSIDLETAYNGLTKQEKLFNMQRKCSWCKGSGAEAPEYVQKCPKCKGEGFTIERRDLPNGFYQQWRIQCPQCGGTGSVVTKTCHVCKGKRVTVGEDSVYLDIPPGAAEGYELKFPDFADQPYDMTVLPGDLIFRLKVKPHPRFTREGDNLRYVLPLSLYEALFGFHKTIRSLDGRDIPVERSGVTQPQEVISIPGEGMPVLGEPGKRGRLLVQARVSLPTESQLALQRESLQAVLAKLAA